LYGKFLATTAAFFFSFNRCFFYSAVPFTEDDVSLTDSTKTLNEI